MTIAERIRLTRQQKELSQKDLADKSGVNIKSLSRYELGSSVPPADALKAIAEALGVSADYLLNDKQVQIKDTELMQKFEVVQQLQGDAKRLVNNFLDMVIRDFKTKQAFHNKNSKLMYTTYHFKSVADINADILEAIKIAFRGKAVSITVKEETEDNTNDIPEWQMLLALKEKENIEQGNTELKNWNDVKNSFNFKS